MRKRIKYAVIATLTSSLLGTGIAAAEIVHIAGGIWDYGSANGTVWSHFYHNGRKHGSTAIGKFTSDSGCVNKNVWSRASTPTAAWGNKSYYRFC